MDTSKITPWSVSHLTTSIQARLEEHYAEVWVEGEISNYNHAASGHMYFNLKDAKATLRCTFFRGVNLRRRFDPKDGMKVLAKGSITVYPQKGDYQLQVEHLQLTGLGEAELALRQLREKLGGLGWFSSERKRHLPRYPRRVGMIASASGAALRDMLEVLAKRWPIAEVIVRPSRVQGLEAPQEIALALQELNRLHRMRGHRLDAIVLGRGGGSSEDLSAFNTEVVAAAMVQSEVPVISAVGHEIDFTVADQVADYRALTPTEAIVKLCPDRQALVDDLQNRYNQMTEALKLKIRQRREKLQNLQDRPVFRRPLDGILQAQQFLDDQQQRLTRAIDQLQARRRLKISSLAERLDALSPLKILSRGYAIVTTIEPQKAILRSAQEVEPGQPVEIRFADGSVVAEIQQILYPPQTETRP